MDKSVKTVKNSLKFKAQPKQGIVSVRIGVRQFQVPIEARILHNEGFVFLSMPAVSDLFTVADKTLSVMESDADATDAYTALNPGKRKGRKRNATAELPREVADALKKIPAGFKLGYGPDGEIRLVKTRRRERRKA